jgi:queuosine precursor transporter
MLLISLYLSSVVAANLLTAWLGPGISILNAFLFIGLDITTRDKLHEKWHGNHLTLKMLLLILSGSIISVLLNRNSMRIAIASTAAFTVAALVDFIVYSKLFHRSKFVKINSSNLFSSAADSIIFPLIAFGWPLLWLISLGQFIAKVFGGFIWMYVYDLAKRLRK